jgi:serine/threonine-protein kinase RsbW
VEKIFLKIPSKLGYERIILSTFNELGDIIKMPENKKNDVLTAIAEACINAIEHGNKEDKNRCIRIIINFKPGLVNVSIKDQGKGYEKNYFEPDIESKLNKDARKRGWGTFLIKKLVENVKTKRERDGFTISFSKTF